MLSGLGISRSDNVVQIRGSDCVLTGLGIVTM